MEKRFIVAIALIFIILFLWPLLFGSRRRPPAVSVPPKEQKVLQKQEEMPKVKPPEPPKLPKESLRMVQTPLYEAHLTTEGARIVSWKLKEYLNRTGEPGYMNLIPSTAQECLAIKWHDPEIQKEMENAHWQCDKESLIIDDVEGAQGSLVFIYTTSKGVTISKKITFFRNDYTMDVDVSFYNPLMQKEELSGYDLCWGAGITEDELISRVEIANEGPMVLLSTETGPKLMKHWQHTGFGCFRGKQTRIPDGQEYDGPISWVSFAGKYFTAVLIPGPGPWWSEPKEGGKRYKVRTAGDETVLSPKDVWETWGSSTTVALSQKRFIIPAGGTEVHRFKVYVGPKKWDILRKIRGRDASTGDLRLGKMIDFGMFSSLGKATLWLLGAFYHVGDNYGVAIILLAVLIKILYLPLTQKSFSSMNKMQELQPKIMALRERYRDDPQRLNKETLKLYKQHGASPFGGCLPLLLQLPVFWALFSTLRGAVEMRGAVFIPGWINDLSLPDTVAEIAGFPIRVLPILMTGNMLIQQFLFGTGSPGQSNKMMALMPVIFMFIFYGMPSGLVLYWLCNDIFSFGHRFLIKLKQDARTQTKDEEESKNRRLRKGNNIPK